MKHILGELQDRKSVEVYLLHMSHLPLLSLHLGSPMLEIVCLKFPHVHGRDEEWGVGEEIIHLLQWTFLGLWLYRPCCSSSVRHDNLFTYRWGGA